MKPQVEKIYILSLDKGLQLRSNQLAVIAEKRLQTNPNLSVGIFHLLKACAIWSRQQRQEGRKKSSIITEAALIPSFAINHNRNPKDKTKCTSVLCIMCLP